MKILVVQPVSCLDETPSHAGVSRPSCDEITPRAVEYGEHRRKRASTRESTTQTSPTGGHDHDDRSIYPGRSGLRAGRRGRRSDDRGAASTENGRGSANNQHTGAEHYPSRAYHNGSRAYHDRSGVDHDPLAYHDRYPQDSGIVDHSAPTSAATPPPTASTPAAPTSASSPPLPPGREPNDCILYEKYYVCGLILEKYKSMDGPRGSLGMPTSNEKVLPDQVGRVSVFEHGSIYWSPSSDAHPIWGRIGDKWGQKGWEGGFLHYPTSDELRNPDGRGLHQTFQGGSIYYSPETDAHSIGGLIGDKWSQLGWEKGSYGYPVTDEEKTPDGIGRYNHFQGGSIYWTSGTGAQQIPGQIFVIWANEGFENGAFGYPIAAPTNPVDPTTAKSEEPANGTVVQRYQNGTIGADQNGHGSVTSFKPIGKQTLQGSDSNPAEESPGLPTQQPSAEVPTEQDIWHIRRHGKNQCNVDNILRTGYYDGSPGSFGYDKMFHKHNIANEALFNEMLREPGCGQPDGPWRTNYHMLIGIRNGCKIGPFFCEEKETQLMFMQIDKNPYTDAPEEPKEKGMVTMYCDFGDPRKVECPTWVNRVWVPGT
ncbi:LGFP repeat-containing protein [Rhodococcus jostii]|uniref:LGFP repeat-containing protein n=1 Tax=Rhodococcus jostii TaxID=132919 RepID=UPI003627D24A